MIERIVFLPMPPLLDPDVSRGAASELDQLRAVIDATITEATTSSDSVAALGTDEALEMASYLLSRVSPEATVLPANLDTEPEEETTLFVMGDGTAKRTEKAPGYVDPRAHEFDHRVREIFETAQLAELATLDQELAEALLVAGISPWKAAGTWVDQSGSNWQLHRFHFEDPYGVAYFVADFARQ